MDTFKIRNANNTVILSRWNLTEHAKNINHEWHTGGITFKSIIHKNRLNISWEDWSQASKRKGQAKTQGRKWTANINLRLQVGEWNKDMVTMLTHVHPEQKISTEKSDVIAGRVIFWGLIWFKSQFCRFMIKENNLVWVWDRIYERICAIWTKFLNQLLKLSDKWDEKSDGI